MPKAIKSVARREELKIIKGLFEHITCNNRLSLIIDLGGEDNHYRELLSSYCSSVKSVNLPSSSPDISHDLTKNFYKMLSQINPDCIVSINTIEHLRIDEPFFESVLSYANDQAAKNERFHLIIACPMMHKLHALPHDYRRYTYNGLLTQIKPRLNHSKIKFAVIPVGGDIITLIESLMVQYSYVFSVPINPLLKLWRFFDSVLYRLKHRNNFNQRLSPYPLGYVVHIYSSVD